MTVDEPAAPTGAPAGGGGAPTDDAPVVRRVAAPPGSPRWTWWARISLRTRLVAIVSALLAVGLVVAAIASTTLVQRYLVDQVDSELLRNADQVVLQSQQSTGKNQTALPSEWYVEVDFLSGGTLPLEQSATKDMYGVPVTPDLTLTEVKVRDREPFTVDAKNVDGTDASTQWRLIAATGTSTTDGSLNSIVYVGLPLADVSSTVHQLSKVLGLTALAVILLGAVLGWWLVRRELRPLHAIETTAASIAAGDLTQRIPQEPPSTEVGSLTASLNVMLAQIEAAFVAQEASEARMRRFVSDASHELRTPLATIRGYGELYRMGALTSHDQVDDTMRRIEDSANRMGTLVNDLLALARLDEGRPLRQDDVDLTVLAADSVRDLVALDPTRDVQLVSLNPPAPGADTSDGPAPVVVVGDEERLRQVLANLVGNVARHTASGTPAQIAVGTSEGRAVLEVRDHGTGITSEQSQHVFERFYRADSSRNRASGGSGLGLAIVAAIAGAHHGRVGVVDTPGGGLTVRLELPLAGPAAATDVPTADAASATPAAG
ncbi:sensor histidine kinase [Luteimicrobium subarcticum]|uniref:sensor histidine kinase n=1 Tax=Luteimicrobium subarcticum TaxID=620910 RepID=UPI001FE35107|nr:HAMP domain-containing sensor histidine kinase [Luteimicrobium subarcticum]